MQKCKTYHYNVNGQNIEIEENLNVNKFISKEEFQLAITPSNDDNDYDKLVSKLAVHVGTRNKITGKFVDLYFFKNIVSALIIIIFLASCGSKSGKRVKNPRAKNQKQFIIIPMNQENEGRPLFTLKTKDSTYDYMYAEEIAVSLIRDSVIVDEMVHMCDHDECWEQQ